MGDANLGIFVSCESGESLKIDNVFNHELHELTRKIWLRRISRIYTYFVSRKSWESLEFDNGLTTNWHEYFLSRKSLESLEDDNGFNHELTRIFTNDTWFRRISILLSFFIDSIDLRETQNTRDTCDTWRITSLTIPHWDG